MGTDEHYSTIRGKSQKDLKKELQEVHEQHYADKNFNWMVDLFAKDDFYKCHYVAKQYLWFTQDT